MTQWEYCELSWGTRNHVVEFSHAQADHEISRYRERLGEGAQYVTDTEIRLNSRCIEALKVEGILGDAGWELVALDFGRTGAGGRAYRFKRERPGIGS